MRIANRFPAFVIIYSLLCGCAATVNSAQEQKSEKGILRWISKSFQGKLTASGEPHEYIHLVAAHRTFPFGTYVHVTNRANKKKVIVRINDRIPSNNDSILLVSWRAAKMLGMLERGFTQAEISRIKAQTGIASWYGKDFHGRKTANGEIYNMDEMTAAHKELPFNTRVRVINLKNNKSVIVRINDRGPFIKGRIIDLSRKAATEVGILLSGIAKVRIELLPPLQKSDD